MPQPEGVTLNDARLKALLTTYRRAVKKVQNEILSATSFEKSRRLAILGGIRGILDDLRVEARAWAKEEIPIYYREGLIEAERELQKLGASVQNLAGFTLVDRQAVSALVDDVVSGMDESIRGLARGSSNILASAQQQQINQVLAEGFITGETQKQVAAQVKEVLRTTGISSIVDRSGRKWNIDSYTSMLVQTKAVEARNRGLGNRMAQHGYDLVQVSSHNSRHHECRVWEGEILSYTGASDDYRTVDQATDAGLFHPRCQHAINVIQPDLADKTQAYKNPYNDIPPENIYSSAPVSKVIKRNGQNIVRLKRGDSIVEIKLTKGEAAFIQKNGVQFINAPRKTTGALGRYDRSKNAIYIYDINNPMIKRTVWHEIGHAIDEEYARGMMSSTIAKKAVLASRDEITIRRIALENDLGINEARKFYEPFKNKRGESKYLDYITKQTEVFGNGYAQYKLRPKEFKKYAPQLYRIYKGLF